MSNDMGTNDYKARCKQLRERLLDELGAQGFDTSTGQLTLSTNHKAALRAAHAKSVAHNIARSRSGLERHEKRLLKFIARGAELVPERIRPILVEVTSNSEEELLFRYARLHWSIPVSAGYGRRLRFLIMDEAHGKLIGIIGLCDPVFVLKPRDTWVGWNAAQRKMRLANVMDAFVLGAVPPYSMLLGGKLAALAATSQEIQQSFLCRYGRKPTVIAGKTVGPLAMITTTSALGRSSIYNRLRFDGQMVFRSVGYTKGSGDFPFFNGFYHELRDFVAEHYTPTAKHQKWGIGFRNRREVVLKALSALGLPRNLIYHGVAREVFVVPLAENTAKFLRGDTDCITPYRRSFAHLVDHFMERWLLPRASRDKRYTAFNPESWRLWNAKR